MDEADLIRVRRAVAAYFRAASALGSASLALRHAALLVTDQDRAEVGEDEEPDDEFLLERAATYSEKAEFMSRSAVALLAHADKWFAHLENVAGDVDELLGSFALDIQRAADAYAEVSDVLGEASFAQLDSYPDLVQELRGAVQFLSSEAAVFAALAAGELDGADDEELEEEQEDIPYEETVESGAAPTALAPGSPLVFDRRVPGPLLAQLAAGGLFEWVTDLARSPVRPGSPPLDLGLRASPKQHGSGHATLYLGTTQVLGLHMRPDRCFRLTPHQPGGLFKDIEIPFDQRWNRWQPLGEFSRNQDAIRSHVDAAIAAAPSGRQVEGLYQAALAKLGAGEFALVDREVMLAFTSQEQKLALKAEVRAPLERALQKLKATHPVWARNAKVPGDKLDALAIDSSGRLLAIEVKPGAQSRGVTWTPVQVAMYVRLLRAWIDADPPNARDVLEGMARQRAALQLGAPPPTLAEQIEVVPVIAIGKPITSPRGLPERFALVREALAEAGEPLAGLRLWAIEGTGEISVTDATELDERFW